MTDVATLGIPLLLTALACASITALVAMSRDRGPLIWFVLGGLLGPLALVLLVFAPRGRCESCGWRVAGWPRRCTACGALLRSPQSHLEPSPAEPSPAEPSPSEPSPAEPLLLVAMGGSAIWADPDELSDIVRPFPRSPDDDPGSPAAVYSRIPRSRSRATALVTVDEPVPAAIRVGATRTIPPVAAPTAPPNDVVRSQEKAILATALFLTGSSSCQPGMHYALAILAGSLLVIGPLEHTRDAVVLDRRLGSITVTADGDRLLIQRRAPGVRMWSLAFSQFSGQSAEWVERTLVDAGSAHGRDV